MNKLIKKCLVVIIIPVIAAWLVVYCGSARSADYISKDKAARIARAVAPKYSDITVFDKMDKRSDYPPFSECYVYKAVLPIDPGMDSIAVDNPSGGYSYRKVPGVLVKSFTWIEANSGVLLEYIPDAGYGRLKNQGRPPIDDSKLISEQKVKQLAENYLRIGGLSVDNMRVTRVWLNVPRNDENYYYYCINWARYKQVKGVGDVELPETVGMYIDAETGELDRYFYKKYPVTIDINAPEIEQSRAEEIAQECCKPRDVESIETKLQVYPGNIKGKAQTLVWYVKFREKGKNASSGLDALINAYDGSAVSYSMYPMR